MQDDKQPHDQTIPFLMAESRKKRQPSRQLVPIAWGYVQKCHISAARYIKQAKENGQLNALRDKRNYRGVVVVENPRPCLKNGRPNLPNPGLQQQIGTTLQSEASL